MACGTVGDLPPALGLNPTNHTFASRTPMQNESCHRRSCSITKGEVQYEDWWAYFNVCCVRTIELAAAGESAGSDADETERLQQGWTAGRRCPLWRVEDPRFAPRASISRFEAVGRI